MESDMIGAEDRAAVSALIGDLAGTVCECVRAVPPGWVDPDHPDREPPDGRCYVRGADGEEVCTLTAQANCLSCGGSGLIQIHDYSGRCACVRRLPAGWLFREAPLPLRWPEPPLGKVYRIDPANPKAPPRWTVDPDCAYCGGTGLDRRAVAGGPGPGLVPVGSTRDGDHAEPAESPEEPAERFPCHCSSCGRSFVGRRSGGPLADRVFCGRCFDYAGRPARGRGDSIQDPSEEFGERGKQIFACAACGRRFDSVQENIVLVKPSLCASCFPETAARPDRGGADASQSPRSYPAGGLWNVAATDIVNAAVVAITSVRGYPHDVAMRALQLAAQVVDDVSPPTEVGS